MKITEPNIARFANMGKWSRSPFERLEGYKLLSTSSYKDKLDPRVLPTINLVLALYQILAVDDGGAEELLPELIEKFKKERCPDYPQMDTDGDGRTGRSEYIQSTFTAKPQRDMETRGG